jgi:hypothetical protein
MPLCEADIVGQDPQVPIYTMLTERSESLALLVQQMDTQRFVPVLLRFQDTLSESMPGEYAFICLNSINGVICSAKGPPCDHDAFRGS